MSHIRQLDHVGLTVADLDSATAFFADLGLEVEGRTFVEGEFIDTVIGVPNSRTEISCYGHPAEEPGSSSRASSGPTTSPDRPPRWRTSWVCAACFQVDDLQAAVDGLAANGYGLVGGIGQYENTWRMAQVRGPQGIVVSLTERID
jgi:catechol 2,3-dioxygenase-like lactoylglutathione lyase family enzyme